MLSQNLNCLKSILYGCAGEGRTVFMEKKTVSAIMLTLLFVSLLSLMLNVGIAYDSG